jgi:hypothetical protein
MTDSLDPATRTRLEKVAVDNGFDQEQPRDGLWLAFSSTQAPVRLWLTSQSVGVLVAAVSQSHVDAALDDHGIPIQLRLPVGAVAARSVSNIAALHHLVRRAFQLSRTLPDELLNRFQQQTANLPRTTEIERLVVERVGQTLFREGLLEYWQERCAVTGLAVPELLRASHIKPWAACDTDAERLDIFNGLLLAPNVDAAFDRGLITVADDGDVLISAQLRSASRRALGLDAPLRVDGLASGHRRYLAFHRTHVFRTAAADTTRETHVQEEHRASQAARLFDRYIGIDYSGAQTPTSRLDGLRVYVATPTTLPGEQRSVGQTNWTRRELAEWLVKVLSDGPPSIIGIDHAFSFPIAYFDRHHLQRDWPEFLDDFQRHWPAEGDDVWVRDLRNAPDGAAAARRGETTWRRLTERRAGAAKSVFHFGVQGEVATSTHAGLPWLRYLRKQLGSRVHFWPFDGWNVPQGRCAVVEVYPSLWRARFPPESRTGDQHDAYSVAAWLRDADASGGLTKYLNPPLSADDRAIAAVEGWILGTELEERDA